MTDCSHTKSIVVDDEGEERCLICDDVDVVTLDDE